MANYYVYSAAAGANNGTSWANAYTTLEVGLSGKSPGDVMFVAHDHNELKATMLTLPGGATDANSFSIYCADRAGSVPPVAADLRTTAQISINNAAVDLFMQGAWKECYGIIFSASSGAHFSSIQINPSQVRSMRFVNCTFRIPNSHTSSRLNIAAAAANNCAFIFENCKFEFGNTSNQCITANGGRFIFRNNSGPFLLGSVSPALLFGATSTGAASHIFMEGADLSLMVGKNIASLSNTAMMTYIFKDCLVGSGTGFNSGTGGGPGAADMTVIRCGEAGQLHKNERHNYMGSLTTFTSNYMTGGATDGTTPFSWRVITSVNSANWGAFECLPIHIWNDTVGSPKTITVQGQWSGAAIPLNTEVFMDVEYLGTGYPLGTRVSSGPASYLHAGVAHAAGSGTWVTPLTTKFAMSHTVTPQAKGPIAVYLMVRKISTTVYFDPKPVIT